MNTGLTIERLMLLSGIGAAALFLVVPTILMLRREGFDIERHAISMLSLGESGWIMKAVFIVSGILTMLCARGLYLQLSDGWSGFIGALLIGAYGFGLVMAGMFDAPEGLGFPPGTPEDLQPVMTPAAILHSIAFMVAFGSLIVACFAFALSAWSSGQTVFALASAAVGVALPALIALGMSMVIAPGIAFYIAAALGWLWLAAAVLLLPQS